MDREKEKKKEKEKSIVKKKFEQSDLVHFALLLKEKKF